MRRFVLMALAALGLAFAAPAMSSAAPVVGGNALQAAAEGISPIEEVHRRRWHHRHGVRRYWAPRRYYARRYSVRRHYAPRRYYHRRRR